MDGPEGDRGRAAVLLETIQVPERDMGRGDAWLKAGDDRRPVPPGVRAHFL